MSSYVLLDASDMEEKMTEIDRLIVIHDSIAADHISEEIERKTFPYVPLKFGYLQDGFHRKQVSQSHNLQMDIWYSAIGNNYYDYAAIQHDVQFDHPIKGRDHYMEFGIRDTDIEGLYAYHVSHVL
jgi:hypothetical protein